MVHTGPTLCKFDKWNCQVFIYIKKYELVFKIRNYRFKELTSVQDLKASFMFLTIFLRYLWKSLEKNVYLPILSLAS